MCLNESSLRRIRIQIKTRIGTRISSLQNSKYCKRDLIISFFYILILLSATMSITIILSSLLSLTTISCIKINTLTSSGNPLSSNLAGSNGLQLMHVPEKHVSTYLYRPNSLKDDFDYSHLLYDQSEGSSKANKELSKEDEELLKYLKENYPISHASNQLSLYSHHGLFDESFKSPDNRADYIDFDTLKGSTYTQPDFNAASSSQNGHIINASSSSEKKVARKQQLQITENGDSKSVLQDHPKLAAANSVTAQHSSVTSLNSDSSFKTASIPAKGNLRSRTVHVPQAQQLPKQKTTSKENHTPEIKKTGNLRGSR